MTNSFPTRRFSDLIECCFAESRAIARPLTQRHPSEGWDLKRPLPRAIAQDPSLRWGDSGRARAVHRNEPLRRGAEDDLSLRPPRMRIAVREIVGRREQRPRRRSEEHTSELKSLMRISYAVFCLKKKKKRINYKKQHKHTKN